MHTIVLKRSVQKQTKRADRRQHRTKATEKWPWGEKINSHKETKTAGNLVSVDAAADRRGGLRSDSWPAHRNLNICFTCSLACVALLWYPWYIWQNLYSLAMSAVSGWQPRSAAMHAVRYHSVFLLHKWSLDNLALLFKRLHKPGSLQVSHYRPLYGFRKAAKTQ